MTVWTIGHGTRPIDELIRLLRVHGVRCLIDVRTIPRSRHNPQFNRDRIADDLAAAGIAYVHMPGLGGLRRPRPDSSNTGWRNSGFRGYADYMETEPFAVNLESLIRRARAEPTAIMCAETVPWRCHRSLISDALTARGVDVNHIMSETVADRHRMPPWAHVEGSHVSYPGATAPKASGA